MEDDYNGFVKGEGTKWTITLLLKLSPQKSFNCKSIWLIYETLKYLLLIISKVKNNIRFGLYILLLHCRFNFYS